MARVITNGSLLNISLDSQEGGIISVTNKGNAPSTPLHIIFILVDESNNVLPFSSWKLSNQNLSHGVTQDVFPFTWTIATLNGGETATADFDIEILDSSLLPPKFIFKALLQEKDLNPDNNIATRSFNVVVRDNIRAPALTCNCETWFFETLSFSNDTLAFSLNLNDCYSDLSNIRITFKTTTGCNSDLLIGFIPTINGITPAQAQGEVISIPFTPGTDEEAVRITVTDTQDPDCREERCIPLDGCYGITICDQEAKLASDRILHVTDESGTVIYDAFVDSPTIRIYNSCSPSDPGGQVFAQELEKKLKSIDTCGDPVVSWSINKGLGSDCSKTDSRIFSSQDGIILLDSVNIDGNDFDLNIPICTVSSGVYAFIPDAADSVANALSGHLDSVPVFFSSLEVQIRPGSNFVQLNVIIRDMSYVDISYTLTTTTGTKVTHTATNSCSLFQSIPSPSPPFEAYIAPSYQYGCSTLLVENTSINLGHVKFASGIQPEYDFTECVSECPGSVSIELLDDDFCVYDVRIRDNVAFIVPPKPDDTGMDMDVIAELYKKCDEGEEFLVSRSVQMSIKSLRRHAKSSPSDHIAGDYIVNAEFVNQFGNTITVPLSPIDGPDKALLSGSRGTVTENDIIYDGSDNNKWVDNLNIVLWNWLAANTNEGYDDYFIRFDDWFDGVILKTQIIHQPTKIHYIVTSMSFLEGNVLKTQSASGGSGSRLYKTGYIADPTCSVWVTFRLQDYVEFPAMSGTYWSFGVDFSYTTEAIVESIIAIDGSVNCPGLGLLGATINGVCNNPIYSWSTGSTDSISNFFQDGQTVSLEVACQDGCTYSDSIDVPALPCSGKISLDFSEFPCRYFIEQGDSYSEIAVNSQTAVVRTPVSLVKECEGSNTNNTVASDIMTVADEIVGAEILGPVMSSGDSFFSLTISSTGAPIGPIPLEPNTPHLGNVDPADLVFDGSNGIAMRDALFEIVSNYFDSTGITTDQYDFYVFPVNQPQSKIRFRIGFRCKHQPTGTWIGLTDTDVLSSIISSIPIDSIPDFFSVVSLVKDLDKREVVIDSDCDIGVTLYSELPDQNIVDLANSSYNLINVLDPVNPPLIVSDPVSSRCEDGYITAAVEGDPCDDPVYTWTGGTEVPGQPNMRAVRVDEGVVTLNAECGDCTYINSITIRE